MKKTLLLLSATALFANSVEAGKTVPYASDFYVNYSLDEGWQMVNNVRSDGISWSPTGISDDLLALDFKGAAQKIYSADQTSTADTWLISPAVDVTAGTEYTISIYARTKASFGETESFKITAATASDTPSLKSGVVILNKPNYSNTGDYEELTATFTPEATGEIYFGVQCYSAPDMDHLFVTHFSVSDGSEPGGDDTPDVSVEGKALPYSFIFSDEDLFASDWSSVAGPDAVVTNSWDINKYSGFASWDKAQNQKEDNWLISPGLAVAHAGAYAIDAKVWANGKLELLLGTDPADLTTFSVVNTFENTSFPSDSDKPIRSNISIETAGTYYLAFRACSEEGTYMGHRVYSVSMKENLVTPGIVTDLSVTADLTDELAVYLSWTYPSLTNTGETLKEIVKAEVYRTSNDAEEPTLINTFHYPTPGSMWACSDETLTEAGVYNYYVVVYGENGADNDNQPMVVSSGFVGKPYINFPCSINLSYDSATAAMCTIVDQNADENSWVYDSSSWNPLFVSTNPGEVEMDDYVSTPYLTLTAGYYLVNFKVGGKNSTYELGYATDRHTPASSFVKVAEINNDDSSSTYDHKYVVVITEDGDYCFTVHHVGALIDPTSTYYNTVKFSGFSVSAQTILPEIVTELDAVAAADNSLAATINWKNPTLDNGGVALTSLTKAIIYRDGEEIAILTEGLIPGELSSYEDTAVPSLGEHIYKVEIYNENGCSEADAPEISVYVGPGLDIPYSTTTFDDWKVINSNDDWYKWEKDYDGNYGFSQSWGSDPDDYTMSPILELANECNYKLTVVTCENGTLEVDLVVGSAYEPSKLQAVGKVAGVAAETEYVFNFSTSQISAVAEEDVNMIPLSAGKTTFGFHASKTGVIKLKSFELIDNGTLSGCQTIAAAVDGLGYYNGVITTSSVATSISVYALNGKALMTAQNVDCLNLSSLEKGQTVIITAVIDGKAQTLKIVL